MEDFNAQPHCPFDSSQYTISKTKVDGTLFDFELCDANVVSGQRGAGKFKPRPNPRKGKSKPSKTINQPEADSSRPSESGDLVPAVHQAEAKTSLPSESAHSVPFDNNTGIHEISISEFPLEEILDCSSVGLGDSLVSPPEAHVDDEPTSFMEAMFSQDADLGDMNLDDDPGNLAGQTIAAQILTESDLPTTEIEGGESSSRPRRRPTKIGDLPVDEEQSVDDPDPTYEPPSASNIDEDEDNEAENRVGSASKKRRAPRKAKEPSPGNDKQEPKCRKTKKASDESTKEPPRKKFSHSSRRKRRRVDKALLDTPEEEIDPLRLPIKDLILLAEHRERTMTKEAAAKLKTPQTNQSTNDSFHADGSHNDEDTYDRDQDYEEEEVHEQPHHKAAVKHVNHQTYMVKQPSTRWSKLDTERFYEAIRQFGLDFSMIELMFPNRGRRQLKLKYAREDRQHPLRVSEAANNRAKDHSHFESVIEQLQQAAKEKHESFANDDSDGLNNEEEAEDTACHDDTNNGDETKHEQKDEAFIKEQADIVEVQNSPLKPNESDGDDDDDLDRWNNFSY